MTKVSLTSALKTLEYLSHNGAFPQTFQNVEILVGRQGIGLLNLYTWNGMKRLGTGYLRSCIQAQFVVWCYAFLATELHAILET